ncbi:hypothetical protein GA0115245_11005 [Streptomyces sp. di188]|nr:hypothetical protein GA0115245_11005 [Streptomyces sp. di188]
MPSRTVSPALVALALLLAQFVVPEQGERLVRGRLVVAAVVGEPRDRVVRELVVADPVAAAQLDRVHAEFGGQLVHDPLDGVRGFRTSRAPVGVGGRAGGEHARAAELVGVHLVDRRVHERAEDRHARGDQHQVGAHVGEQVHLQAAQPAVAVGGDLDVLDHAAPVVGGQVALGAGLGPLHGPAEAPRDRQRDRLLAVHLELGAEAAAHVGRDDPQLVLGYPGHHGEHHPQDVRDLRGRVHGVLAGRGERGDHHRTRLHRVGDQPLLVVAAPEDHLGALPDGRVVLTGPERPVVAAVRALVGVHQRRVLGERGLQVEHRRQRLVLDLDRLQRVRRRVPVAGHDDRHRVTRVAHLVHGERRMVRVHHVLGHRPRARQRSHPLREIASRERGHHAREFQGVGDVDALDARVRHGAAQDRQVQHPGGLDVVGPVRLAGEQPRVLLAQPRPAHLGLDGALGHARTSSSSEAAASTARTMFW